ncbi:MAG TPA: VWA domain-containing protein [Bacteroidales bacterium]|nr:VWA domain-containing protein [Bacteroidales bacterium]
MIALNSKKPGFFSAENRGRRIIQIPYLFILVFVICHLSFVNPLFAQTTKDAPRPKPTTRILFVFDASQSMYGRWQSATKFDIAVKLFSNILDSLRNQTNLELALRMYGNQKQFPPQDCNDTRLEVPFAKDNSNRIKHVLKTTIPKGTTPIAYALSMAPKDFPPCDNCRNVVILITDGLEECGGDPCAVSLDLQRKGIMLKPFIVGIGKNFRDQFECVGTYFDASDEKEFRNALNVIISRTLNPTTVHVNLIDEYGKPTETNVNMTFYDRISGKVKYNFIHSLNARGVPDTLDIDPLMTYDLVVHTIPPVRKDSIKLTPGIHNIVGVKTPQGFLTFKTSGNSTLKYLPCIIRKKGQGETINVQQFDQTEKYITGLYDVEILCLPRIKVSDVQITQNHTTTIETPMPGIAVIQKSTNGYGSLYLENKDDLEWIYNLRDNPQNQETLYLQPGSYRIVFRSKYTTQSSYTLEKPFKVEPGQTINLKLYPN